MSKELIIEPRLSEKAYGMSQEHNVFVFNVPKNANAQMVASAVTTQFEVKVADVRLVNHKGKAKRTLSKGSRRNVMGRQSDAKKAYVRLVEGESLPFFAAIEEEETKQKEAEEKAAKSEEKKHRRFRRDKEES